jgi:hypothetical protein
VNWIVIRIVVLGAALPPWALQADTLTFRDGKSANGTFLGGTTRQIEFQLTSGESLKAPVDAVKSLTFSVPAATASPEPARSSGRSPVLVPAGLAFRVRTIDGIDVDATQAGAQFRGSLDDPIMLGGDVIVPRGADVVLVAAKVQQGGRMKGSDLVELKVNSISVRGRTYPVVTNPVEAKSGGEGKKTTRKVVGGAGLGAIVGGIAGGGTGAAIGALAGGAGGAILAAGGQPHLKVPPETRLQFQLMADWKIQ